MSRDENVKAEQTFAQLSSPDTQHKQNSAEAHSSEDFRSFFYNTADEGRVYYEGEGNKGLIESNSLLSSQCSKLQQTAEFNQLLHSQGVDSALTSVKGDHEMEAIFKND